MEAAERADTLSQKNDPAIADTLARAYFLAGNARKAAETQERAIRLAKTKFPSKVTELQGRLREYQKAGGK